MVELKFLSILLIHFSRKYNYGDMPRLFIASQPLIQLLNSTCFVILYRNLNDWIAYFETSLPLHERTDESETVVQCTKPNFFVWVNRLSNNYSLKAWFGEKCIIHFFFITMKQRLHTCENSWFAFEKVRWLDDHCTKIDSSTALL